MHSFESGLMPADRRLTILGTLVERDKPVPRPAHFVVLGGRDREITHTLFLGFLAGTRVQDRAVAGRSAGSILHNLEEHGKPVPRPALGVVLGCRDWGMG